jgi:hypothetical protein
MTLGRGTWRGVGGVSRGAITRFMVNFNLGHPRKRPGFLRRRKIPSASQVPARSLMSAGLLTTVAWRIGLHSREHERNEVCPSGDMLIKIHPSASQSSLTHRYDRSNITQGKTLKY